MLFSILLCLFLFSTTSGCPENPVPPCTCRMIGFHASIITCKNVDNEMELEKSMKSMKSIKVPIRTVEIFEAHINYLPSELFKGLRIPKLFIAGSSMVALTDSDTAFEGLEDTLEILQIQDCTFFAGWSWSHLRNMKALADLEIKLVPMEVDEDVKEISHLDVKILQLTRDSISYLHDTAFSTFHNLETLSLKVNPIKELKRSMFPNPALKLQQLIFSHTELEHLPTDLFTNMPQLQSIILADNKILTVDKTTFEPVWNNLKKIDLTGNPLRCDCRMNWLLGVSFPRNTWASCDEPKQIKGKDLKLLESNDLWC